MILNSDYALISTQNRLAFTLIIAFLLHAMLALGLKTPNTQPIKQFNQSIIEVNISHPRETIQLIQNPNPMLQPQLSDLTVKRPKHIAEDIPLKTDSTIGPLKVVSPNRTEEKETTRRTATTKPLPTARQLINRSLTIASLHGGIQDRLERSDTEVRHKYISAETKEHAYAAYMEAWRAKVEKVGNMNYPHRAREKGLSGSLLLDVAINSDGSVKEIKIRRSSGHDLLDAGAVKIVKLAAPFSPFPDHIKNEVDILHVTRNWKFVNDQRPSN
jgi:periplasmic protein TonB